MLSHVFTHMSDTNEGLTEGEWAMGFSRMTYEQVKQADFLPGATREEERFAG